MLSKPAPNTSIAQEERLPDVPAHGPSAVISANFATTLKLRLSLLITFLLAILALCAGAYVVHKARDDIRVEARSALKLTNHFLDAQIDDLRSHWEVDGYSPPQFKLHELGDIRHVRIRFYDAAGELKDSNDVAQDPSHSAPRWFAALIPLSVEPLQSRLRKVSFNGQFVGRLMIAPDPSYETDEMWTTSVGLLQLLLAFLIVINVLVWWAASRAMRPVGKILQALAEVRSGNLASRLPQFGLPELSRISVGFNHMAETLQRSVGENRRLTRRLLTTQESERANLARELHDEIGQSLSAIHADAAAIRNQGGAGVRDSAEAIVAVTQHIKNIVRSMLQRLRPPVLEGLGLAPALRELSAGFQQRNPGIVCTLRYSGNLLDLDPEVAVAVYRVVQECLTNIAVHANARHATIEVNRTLGEISGQPCHISVDVGDDGVGFFLMSTSRGFGLIGIRERVNVLGGVCDIVTHPGRGTRIHVRVPVQ